MRECEAAIHGYGRNPKCRSLAPWVLILILLAPGHAAADLVLPGPVEVYRTALYTGERLARHADLQWKPAPEEKSQAPRLEVNSNKTKQSLLGFGGAFTEAAALNWKKLDAAAREEVIKLYFGSPESGGNGYSMGRVHINSCDFGVGSYSFDDVKNDTNLLHFDNNVQHDQVAILPFIRAAMERAASHLQRPVEEALSIIGSPWSPPAWMKFPFGPNMTASMDGSATPMGLQPQYQRTWANYLSKFISAYQKQGVKLWGITAQNEPDAAPPWEACAYSPRNESLWIRNHLGPVMRRDHPGLQILGFDHNKDHMLRWADELYLADNGSSEPFVDGMAVHWYTGDYFENMQKVSNIGGEGKWLIPSEACSCPSVAWGNAQLGTRWSRAEYLAHDIVGDLAAGAHGWMDWNLVLDPSGKPNHNGGSCDAAVIADPERLLGQDSAVVTQPSYFYMGHFSRFLSPGSKIISSVFTVGMPEEAWPDSYLFIYQAEDPSGRLWGQNRGVVGLAGCDAGSRQRWKVELVNSGRRMASHDHHADHVEQDHHHSHHHQHHHGKQLVEQPWAKSNRSVVEKLANRSQRKALEPQKGWVSWLPPNETTTTSFKNTTTTINLNKTADMDTTTLTTSTTTKAGPSSCIRLAAFKNSRGNDAAHSVMPDACLDVKAWDRRAGAKVQFWYCSPDLAYGRPCALNQLWHIRPHPVKHSPGDEREPAIEVVSRLSEHCLSVPKHHVEGMSLELWHCKGSRRQRWIFEKETGVLRWAPGGIREGAGQCLTAGKFKPLEAIAAVSEKDDQVSVVVLNRGERAANFQLYDIVTNATTDFIWAPARSVTSMKYARHAAAPAPSTEPTTARIPASPVSTIERTDYQESQIRASGMLLVVLAGLCAILAAFANGVLVGAGMLLRGLSPFTARQMGFTRRGGAEMLNMA